MFLAAGSVREWVGTGFILFLVLALLLAISARSFNVWRWLLDRLSAKSPQPTYWKQRLDMMASTTERMRPRSQGGSWIFLTAALLCGVIWLVS